jgi:RimJ/RimL family protein N-acetyltransferase
MPFLIPWTDVDATDIQPNTLKYYWRCRAASGPNHRDLPFAVIREDRVVGCATLAGRDFPLLRQFEIRSWLGREFQGRGLGRELREAALHLGFEGLSATLAKTAAFEDNAPSLGVTRGLGYAPNGSDRGVRRGRSATILVFSLEVGDWTTRLRRNDISIHGLDDCLTLLDLG